MYNIQGIDTVVALGGATKSEAVSLGNSETGSKKRKAEVCAEGKPKAPKPEPESDLETQEEAAFSYKALRPTYTHRALGRLQQLGKMQYCITQNCDDLHARGGFPRDSLSELHGNVFCEFCEVCSAEYYRDYEVDAWSTDCHGEAWFVKCETCGWNHYTSRKCDKGKCRGKLKDTIVNFGDDLHESVLGGLPRAIKECKKADVCVALGSSLTVTPANSLPLMATHLVICNLQETGCDKNATLRVWATCDMLFRALFEEMGLELAPSDGNGDAVV
jgi:mono-ADP-ribosyltransferase sirtuin 6